MDTETMMTTILRVQVDEELLGKLQKESDDVRRSLEDLAAIRLKASMKLPLRERAVVAAGSELEQLETILGGGSLLNGPDLLKKVSRLAGISFLHCRLPFTPNQLEALQEKASRQGLTVDQLVERTAPRIYEQFFDLVARV
jgi:hypothetical protein